ncbi:isochorismatase family protein [Bradyrhizobium sp. 2TAF24]|uniref:isochorismatase family protein n=1 Tax=Bradyrhizobium sp. 2TAF24 TaxID=3233011 RepID=UPI003F8EBBB3
MTHAHPTAAELYAIDPARCALLIVDMQNDFVREGAIMEVAMARRFLPAMQAVQAHCRALGIPVLYTAHVLSDAFDVSPLEVALQPRLRVGGMRPGTDGIEVVAELTPQPDEVVIHKHRFDAFYNTRLDTVLRNIRGPGVVDTLIIIGTVTNICCESTARSAFMRDYKVLFISDANGGLDDASQQATLRIIGSVFGRVLSTADFIKQATQEERDGDNRRD